MRRRNALRLIAGLPAIGMSSVGMATRARARGDVALAEAGALAGTGTPAAPGVATLLVGGPPGGEMDHWGSLLLPALIHALPTETPVRTLRAGGIDGVTAANEFDARIAPDGMTVLLVPGAAALAWLVGDPRAQFDAAQWTSVMAGVTSGVVAGRSNSADLERDQRLRLAASTPTGPEVAALLALDVIGTRVTPVFGFADPSAARAAFTEQAIDLVFLRGQDVPAQLALLAAVGARPLFSFGAIDPAARLTRDPLFPDLPLLTELATGEQRLQLEGPLYRAWRAAAAAVQLDFGLVLPPMTPAAMVALWRRAGLQVASSSEFQAAAAAVAVRPVAVPDANASIGSVAADQQALLALRQWLSSRLHWQPG